MLFVNNEILVRLKWFVAHRQPKFCFKHQAMIQDTLVNVSLIMTIVLAVPNFVYNYFYCSSYFFAAHFGNAIGITNLWIQYWIAAWWYISGDGGMGCDTNAYTTGFW